MAEREQRSLLHGAFAGVRIVGSAVFGAVDGAVDGIVDGVREGTERAGFIGGVAGLVVGGVAGGAKGWVGGVVDGFDREMNDSDETGEGKKTRRTQSNLSAGSHDEGLEGLLEPEGALIAEKTRRDLSNSGSGLESLAKIHCSELIGRPIGVACSSERRQREVSVEQAHRDLERELSVVVNGRVLPMGSHQSVDTLISSLDPLLTVYLAQASSQGRVLDRDRGRGRVRATTVSSSRRSTSPVVAAAAAASGSRVARASSSSLSPRRRAVRAVATATAELLLAMSRTLTGADSFQLCHNCLTTPGMSFLTQFVASPEMVDLQNDIRVTIPQRKSAAGGQSRDGSGSSHGGVVIESTNCYKLCTFGDSGVKPLAVIRTTLREVLHFHPADGRPVVERTGDAETRYLVIDPPVSLPKPEEEAKEEQETMMGVGSNGGGDAETRSLRAVVDLDGLSGLPGLGKRERMIKHRLTSPSSLLARSQLESTTKKDATTSTTAAAAAAAAAARRRAQSQSSSLSPHWRTSMSR